MVLVECGDGYVQRQANFDRRLQRRSGLEGRNDDVLTSHDFKATLMSPKCEGESWVVKGVINGGWRCQSGFVRNIHSCSIKVIR